MATFTRLAALGFCALALPIAAGSWLGNLYLDDQESFQTLRTDIVTSGSPIATPTAEAELLERFLTSRFPEMEIAAAANKLRISMSRLKSSDLVATQGSVQSALTEFSAMMEKRLEAEKAKALADFHAASGNSAIYQYLQAFQDWDWLKSVNLAPRLEVDEFMNWDSSARRGARTGAVAGFGLGLVINLILAISLYRRRASSETVSSAAAQRP
ncbi:hypothetical protein [Shinella sumterensis]|uniref:DUF2937 family protein n=1 Tax=Shinella sumterensis TaxID=1967501 RepID=A0AA50CJG5_9HYPH|nr:hypothetical protein [Shinella sumterensis]WLR96193.1 hypothetical protein Q9313_10665 [Shinella sumterensis]